MQPGVCSRRLAASLLTRRVARNARASRGRCEVTIFQKLRGRLETASLAVCMKAVWGRSSSSYFAMSRFSMRSHQPGHLCMSRSRAASQVSPRGGRRGVEVHDACHVVSRWIDGDPSCALSMGRLSSSKLRAATRVMKPGAPGQLPGPAEESEVVVCVPKLRNTAPCPGPRSELQAEARR